MSAPQLAVPVDLVTSTPSTASGGDWPLIIAVIGAVAFSLVTLHLWLRTRGDGDSDEVAFRELAARLRLSKEQKRLVREIASEHPTATPAALLLSPSALIEGATRAGERGGVDLRDLPGLLAILGVGDEATPARPAEQRERLELIA
ncbi:MAG: hypothetical protein ACIARR_01575 [Phycisphaerales bacterium JB059]